MPIRQMALQPEAQERGQAGDTDLVSSDGTSTEKIEETDQGKHMERRKEKRAGSRKEPLEMLALAGL